LIRRASETVYGLAAALWTTNIKRAHGIADQLRAGAVWVNCYNIFDASMPVGGYKQSGWGREMGSEVSKNYPCGYWARLFMILMLIKSIYYSE
jgi:phenylacetaldehyde dehydrogenase